MAGDFLSLAQYPAGSAVKEPAPNVIISIDNSGSMSFDLNGCYTAETDDGYKSNPIWCPNPKSTNPNPSRLASLKAALISQFGNANAVPPTTGRTPDNSIRLGWQSMWNTTKAPGAPPITTGKQILLVIYQVNTEKTSRVLSQI